MIINSLISGGGGQEPTTGDYTVTVIDYDGTVLLETKGNTGDVIDLPTAPTHDKLIFQEWSASVDVVNNQVTIADNDIMVGAIYKTASGQSEFDITLTKVTGLSVTLNMNGTKDWGDGTSDTATTHTYTAYGDYTITCNGTSITSSLFGQSSSAKNYYCVGARFANITSISSFYYCNSLTNVTIPNGVTSIGGSAFNSCYSLANITIPSSVTAIGRKAFEYCYSLANITIPSGIKSIDSQVFNSCYSLANITIPNSVTSIGVQAFNYCYSLTNVTIPSRVTSIGSYAFSYCYSLTNVTIPNSVTITSIGDGTFFSCYSLTNITIPNSVTSIGSQAFSNCSSLTNITLPNSVTSIGSNAFYSCYSITKYDFSQYTSVPTLSKTNAFNGINGICKIIVPDSLYDSWIASTNWSTYADYIYKVSEVQ